MIEIEILQAIEVNVFVPTPGPSRTRILDLLVKNCPEPRTQDTRGNPSPPNQSDPD
jgi:hypothetical protein